VLCWNLSLKSKKYNTVDEALEEGRVLENSRDEQKVVSETWNRVDPFDSNDDRGNRS
jgi:hypothetical protein